MRCNHNNVKTATQQRQQAATHTADDNGDDATKWSSGEEAQGEGCLYGKFQLHRQLRWYTPH